MTAESYGTNALRMPRKRTYAELVERNRVLERRQREHRRQIRRLQKLHDAALDGELAGLREARMLINGASRRGDTEPSFLFFMIGTIIGAAIGLAFTL